MTSIKAFAAARSSFFTMAISSATSDLDLSPLVSRGGQHDSHTKRGRAAEEKRREREWGGATEDSRDAEEKSKEVLRLPSLTNASIVQREGGENEPKGEATPNEEEGMSASLTSDAAPR